MNVRKILEEFSIIADVSLDNTAKWLPLCMKTSREIRACLKEGVNETDHEDRLNTAAAVLGFYRYTLYRLSRDMSLDQVSPDIVSPVTDRKNILVSASEAWNNIRSSMSDILSDPDFIFQGVK